MPLLAAFTLGLAPVVAYGVVQATLGPDDDVPVTFDFMLHLAMSRIVFTLNPLDFQNRV